MMIKKTLKNIWNEFVYGGHLLALGSASIVLSVLILMGKTSQVLPLLFIAYLTPQIVFNFDHIKHIDNDMLTNPERVRFLKNHQRENYSLLIFYIIALLLTLTFFSNLMTVLYIAILALAGIFYPKKLTKKILGFKNFYTVIIFKSAILLPMVFFLSTNYIFFTTFFIFGLMRGFVNTIFFDIKDMKSDKKENLRTFPIVLDKEKTIKMLGLINLLSAIPLLLGVYYKVFPTYSLVLLIFIIYSYIYLFLGRNSSDKKLRSVSYVMVDGEYIFWPIMLVLAGLLIGK